MLKAAVFAAALVLLAAPGAHCHIYFGANLTGGPGITGVGQLLAFVHSNVNEAMFVWSANFTGVTGLSGVEVYDNHTHQIASTLLAVSPPVSGTVSLNGTSTTVNPATTVPFNATFLGLANHMCMSPPHIFVVANTSKGPLMGPLVFTDYENTGLPCTQLVAAQSQAVNEAPAPGAASMPDMSMPGMAPVPAPESMPGMAPAPAPSSSLPVVNKVAASPTGAADARLPHIVMGLTILMAAVYLV